MFRSKWAAGVVAALLVSWVTFISAKVFALAEARAGFDAALPRIENKLNSLDEYVRKNLPPRR